MKCDLKSTALKYSKFAKSGSINVSVQVDFDNAGIYVCRPDITGKSTNDMATQTAVHIGRTAPKPKLIRCSRDCNHAPGLEGHRSNSSPRVHKVGSTHNNIVKTRVSKPNTRYADR